MEATSQQEVMESWRLWMVESGCSHEIAAQMLKLGYGACAYLWEATEGTTTSV